ncbi:MAG: FUSC family protein [Janthinobacterium lividum]
MFQQISKEFRTIVVERWHERKTDASRIAVQSLVASLLSYLIGEAVGLPDISWAILSSLFAIQTHFDSSLRLGLGQILGATLGTAIGLTCIYCLGGTDETLLRVVIATGLTCGLTALWPELGYSVAAAAVTALEPFPQLHIAIGHAAAIVVGSTIGVGVCFTVWRQMGRDRAVVYIANALDDCRELLCDLSEIGADAPRVHRDALHERFLCHLETARAVVAVTRVRAQIRTGRSLGVALGAAERLWHGLVVLDRASTEQGEHLTAADIAALKDHMAAVREAASGFLSALAAHLREHQAKVPTAKCPDPCALEDVIALTKRDARRQLISAEIREDDDRYHAIHSLLFGLDQAYSNLVQLGRLMTSVRQQDAPRRKPARTPRTPA